MKKIIIIPVLLFLSQIAVGQVDKRIKSIDNWIGNCMSIGEGSTTMGMRNCYMQGEQKMDSLLNIVYKQLMKQLQPEDQEKLKISQRNWLKFYESEKTFTGEVYRSWANYSKYEYGSQINITEAEFTYSLIKERVQRLINYIEAE